MGNYSVVVLDFETTGLSPDCGDRTIEVGAVLISNNRIVDRFESLMNPGMRISSFIETLVQDLPPLKKDISRILCSRFLKSPSEEHIIPSR